MAIEMVRLSAERWNMLANQWAKLEIPSHLTGSGTDVLVLSRPVEIDGIVFLPATYVPRAP